VISTDVAAYTLVFGLFGIAFLLVATSQFLIYRGLVRFRTYHSSKWEELGAPTVMGGNRSAVKAATAWLLSAEASELGDAVLVRQARLARRLNYVGAALFLLWLALWAWSVFS